MNIVQQITNEVSLVIREQTRPGGAWISFQIATPKGVKNTDPWCWTPTVELTRDGQFLPYTYDQQINRVIQQTQALFQGFQSADYVNENFYREISHLLGCREVLGVEYVPQRKLHHLHKWVLENMLTIVPEWSKFGNKPDDKCDRHFGAHPDFKDEEAFAKWFAFQLERNGKLFKNVDLYGVTKKRQGAHLYFCKRSRKALISEVLHCGMAEAVPVPRHTREISGLKDALPLNINYTMEEPSITSTNPDFLMPEEIKKYFANARVAVVFIEHDALDKCWLLPSGIKKFSTKLARRKRIHDLSPREGWEQVLTTNRSYPVVVNETVQVLDELEIGFHCLKLIAPGGCKFMAQVVHDKKEQLFDSEGQPIDILIDARSIARKGAMLFLTMMTLSGQVEPLTEETAVPFLLDHQPTKDLVGTKGNPKLYEGYTGLVPNWYRPGVRSNELCKGDAIATDIRVDALKGLAPKSTPQMEKEFARFKELEKTLEEVIKAL